MIVSTTQNGMYVEDQSGLRHYIPISELATRDFYTAVIDAIDHLPDQAALTWFWWAAVPVPLHTDRRNLIADVAERWTAARMSGSENDSLLKDIHQLAFPSIG